MDNVLITNDLTHLRLKLKHMVEDTDVVTIVYIRDGNNHHDKGGSQDVTSSPYDLFN